MPSETSDGDLFACLASSLLVKSSNLPQLSWVLNDCYQRLEANDWNCELKTVGSTTHQIRITHRLTGEKRQSHPIIDLYRELAYRLQTRMENNQDNYDSSNSLNSALNTLSCSDQALLPGISIKFLRFILSFLEINPLSEYFIVDIILQKLQNHRARICEKDLLESISRARGCFFRYSTNNNISLCNRCAKDLSSAICYECGDFLCSSCIRILHSKGSRQDHCITKFEQRICSECSQHLALAWCINCGDMFCDACFRTLHLTKHRNAHTIELPYTCLCSECNNREANGFCETCLRAMCCDCARSHHATFLQHSRSEQMRSENIDIIVALFQKTQWTRSATPSRHGIIEVMDQLAPLWYDFVHQKVYDEKPDMRKEDLHAVAVDAILKRSTLLKNQIHEIST